MYCEKCGKRLLEGEICSCQKATNLKTNAKKVNAKNTNINFYVIISFLLFIFAGELAYYFYVNAGAGNFLDYLPGAFIKKYQNYFVYALLFMIFAVAAFCGGLAVKEKTTYVQSVIAVVLNFLGMAAVCVIFVVSMYQNYRNVRKQMDQEPSFNLQNDIVLNETEATTEIAQTEIYEEVTEEVTEEQTVDEETKTAEFIETVLEEAEILIQKGEEEKAKSILQQAYATTMDESILNKIYEISDPKTTVPYEEEGSYDEETYEDIEIIQEQSSDTEAFGTNIHRYEYVRENTTWESAYFSCLEKGGHLVTFESQAEFDYVTQELKNSGLSDVIFFIGGRRELNTKEYYWVNESNNFIGSMLNAPEAWNKGCWLHDEPSFEDTTLNIQEHVLSMFYYDDLGQWVWNDVPNDLLSVVSYYDGKLGYICEYED